MASKGRDSAGWNTCTGSTNRERYYGTTYPNDHTLYLCVYLSIQFPYSYKSRGVNGNITRGQT